MQKLRQTDEAVRGDQLLRPARLPGLRAGLCAVRDTARTNRRRPGLIAMPRMKSTAPQSLLNPVPGSGSRRAFEILLMLPVLCGLPTTVDHPQHGRVRCSGLVLIRSIRRSKPSLPLFPDRGRFALIVPMTVTPN